MMAPDFDLTGKVAIVTGGNGGIGFGIARGLAHAGANIVIAARHREKNAQAIAALQVFDVNTLSVTTDVQDVAEDLHLACELAREVGAPRTSDCSRMMSSSAPRPKGGDSAAIPSQRAYWERW
jgi:2-dehydro-3-deoxy-D-gluconate 5-dehydrogenase